MRVALLHPTYWPEVRRGAERLTHDLAANLARCGHEVTILTTHDARTCTTKEGPFLVVRDRRLQGARLERLNLDRHLTRAPRLMARLARGDYDVAHALTHTDGWAAGLARRLGGPPVVLSLMGMPTSRSVGSRRLRRPLLASAIRRAGAVTVLSRPAAQELTRSIGHEAFVLPAGVSTADFSTDAARSREPTVICAASLDDPRKRGPLLLRAFERLRESRPTARLLLAGPGAPAARSLPRGAEVVDADATPDLARLYASAWVSVLPSVDEAFGLVLVESQAAGTPVVAAASGAPPDVVSDPAVGRLFRPDDEADLARALDEALHLAADRATAARCRRHAHNWDWAAVLPSYEALYTDVIRRSGRMRRGYPDAP